MLSEFNLHAPDYQANPFALYARMREEGLSRLHPGGFLVLSRYADNVAVLKNAAVFSASGLRKALEPAWLGPNPCAHTMHSMDPPEHTKMRNLVSTAFLAPVVEKTTPLVQKLVEAAVDGIAGRGEGEMIHELALPVTAGTIGHFLKLDPALHAKFKGWSDAMMSITPEPRSPEHARSVRAALDEEQHYLMSLINERRSSPGEDMVSLLLRAEIDGERLGEGDLVGFLSLLLIAGLETTTHLIGRAMIMLADRPDILDRLRADASLVPAFVEEMLRYDPPVPSLFRYTRQDTELLGHPVPKGTSILCMIASANRDESQFPNPDVFDMDRDTRGALSFGHGIHFCTGAGLARLEARLTLTEIVKRFRRFEHTGPQIQFNHTYTVRGPKTVPLRAIAA